MGEGGHAVMSGIFEPEWGQKSASQITNCSRVFSSLVSDTCFLIHNNMPSYFVQNKLIDTSYYVTRVAPDDLTIV